MALCLVFTNGVSRTPEEVKTVMTILTSNLIFHIVILLTFIIITRLVNKFFVFYS